MASSQNNSPPELLHVCEVIDEAIGLLSRDVAEPFQGLGRYESDVEARVLFIGLMRHVEGLLECADADLKLLPAGGTLARAAFEQGLRIRWLLHPTNVFDREARFLAHLAEEEGMLRRSGKYSETDAFDPRSDQIAEFKISVERALPPGISRLKKLPKFDKMLEELGEIRRYATYTLLSQYTHGSHFMGNLYRRGLGTGKTFGEQVSVKQWAVLLEIAWWSIFHAAQKIEQTCARRDIRSLDDQRIEDINDRLSNLKESDQTPNTVGRADG